MKKIALLIMITSPAFADEFSGYIYDQDGDRVRYYYGEYHDSSHNSLAEPYRRMAEFYKENNRQISENIQAMYQLNELERQTALLQEIANK
jgi:hypothetical protein